MTEENMKKEEDYSNKENENSNKEDEKKEVEPEKKEETQHKVHHHVKKVKKSNIWKTISGILAILLLVSLFTGGFGKTSEGDEKGLTAEEASEKAIEYINTNLMQQGATASLKSIEEANGLYNIKLDIGGREFDSFVTKNGGLLFPSAVDLDEVVVAPPTQETPPANVDVEKSDKPTAELHIFSYCPAGSSTLDSFAEAGKVLKDVANVKVKFFSHMHGEYERQQNIIQECIQKVDYDKYWDYAVDFYDVIYKNCASKRDTECDKTESIKLMEAKGIDYNAVFECVDNEGEALYAQDKEDAGALSLRYSPSIVVNGVYLQKADRTPEGLKAVICGAFNEAPEVCSGVLSATGTESVGNC